MVSSMPSLPVSGDRMTFAEATAGSSAPPDVIARLCLIDVPYLDFDGCRRDGQLVVHEAVRQDILQVFRDMASWDFPIARMVPIVGYGWSDDASMADNNTSAFNYRVVAGTGRLSAHALGLAVDINPFLNPVVYADGRISPPGATYRPGDRGVLSAEHPVVRSFVQRGWQWGGNFLSFQDYHHFEKRAA